MALPNVDGIEQFANCQAFQTHKSYQMHG
jgi:hypothetical protein